MWCAKNGYLDSCFLPLFVYENEIKTAKNCVISHKLFTLTKFDKKPIIRVLSQSFADFRLGGFMALAWFT